MTLRHRAEFLGVQGLRACARLLPFRAVCACGAALGWLFWHLDARHRRVAAANVAAALPERSPEEHARIVRAAFAHFGRLLFELLKFSTLSSEAMLRRVEFEGDAGVRAAFAEGHGVIFVTGHFGYWELQALAHGLRLRPMAVMARALDNPALHALLEQIRTRHGNTVIYRQGTVRRALRVLQEGGGIGVLIDQHIQSRDAITVQFFGRPAATTPLVAALALRTGARIVPLFALPTGPGRYRMVYEPPVDLPPDGTPDPIQVITQRCTDVLEQYVRRDPELWLWMHRRWR